MLSQHLRAASRSLLILLLSILFFLTTPHLQAIHDTNHNGVSDLWEEKFNSGALYLTFNPTADPDGDGWTNTQEATAGTNPGSGAGLTGLVRPKITHTPAVFLSPEEEGGEPELDTPEVITITWPTVAGKKYTLLFSTDLAVGSWIAVGSPRIGAGTEIGTSIPLTQPDGSTAQAIFWRVTINDVDTDSDTLTNAEEAELGSSPYSADGDNDGLSDIAELFTYHTNPISRDSDGDGVSDPDEILIDFTNPMIATDADGDGIPDDFEKYFAKQLLAYQPDATHWGVYHAGLIAGNLDATHDYTGDGMNARELAETLKNLPAIGHSASGYIAEQQERRNKIPWAHYFPPSSGSSSAGMYFHSNPNEYDIGEEIIPTANFSSQYLLSRIDGVTWSDWSKLPSDQLIFYNGMVASGFRSQPILSGNGTNFQGFISQHRCRLIATSADHEDYSRDYLKVIKDNHAFSWNYTEFEAAGTVTIKLPKGRMISDWYEFKTPMLDGSDGRSAEMHLVSGDLQLAIPKPEATAQPPALAVSSASTLQFQSSSTQLNAQSSGDIDFATAPSVIVPEDKEDTEGGWAVLNFDDDDEDGGASGHGQANVKGDWEDANGVEGENDLVFLGIRRVFVPIAQFRLKFDDEHIRIYKKANKTEPVISEVTEFTNDQNKEYITLFIEGIKPHEDDEGTIITQQIKIGASADWNPGDTVKVRVAQPIIAVFEENPDWADTYAHFNNFGKEKAGDDKSRQRFTLKSAGTQPDTFLALGKFYKSGGGALEDVCYSFSQIKGARGERILKIALALQDANVITIGHSNFGMGLAFKGQYTEFTDFFNVAGGGKPAINLTHGFPAHPALNVSGIFTNLAAVDKINSLRWTSAGNRWMTNNPKPNIIRYLNAENPVIAPGAVFPVNSDTITQVGSNDQVLGSRILKWNYKPLLGAEGDGPLDKRVILDIPSTDVPATLKYRSLYLNQCCSYRYFLESFHHGTVFATWRCIKPDNHGHEEFINKMIEGANWQAVEVELEKKEANDDQPGSPIKDRIELSNF